MSDVGSDFSDVRFRQQGENMGFYDPQSVGTLFWPLSRVVAPGLKALHLPRTQKPAIFVDFNRGGKMKVPTSVSQQIEFVPSPFVFVLQIFI